MYINKVYSYISMWNINIESFLKRGVGDMNVGLCVYFKEDFFYY